MLIQKFGGSSLADAARIKRVAEIIADTYQKEKKLIVVVSAMYGETDRLIALAQQIGLTSPREYDALLATGEQVSAALLGLALNALGISARSYTAAQCGILTDQHFGKARILDLDTDFLHQVLDQGILPVITGFQGQTKEGDITTLGRGGSDITATALAAALKADECQIFTDVDGVYTCDPKMVPDARKLTEISFPEMLELSSLGAKVMQSRSMKFAGKYKVPLRIMSSFKEGEGTLITFDQNAPEQPIISGLAFEKMQSKITLQRIPKRPGLASYILGALNEAQIELDMIVQSAPSSENLIDFSFTLHANEFHQALKIVEPIAKDLMPAQIVSADQLAKISLVGVGMRSHAGIAAKMLSVLGQEGISIHLMNAAEIKISAVIDEKYLDLAARVLHESFGLAS